MATSAPVSGGLGALGHTGPGGVAACLPCGKGLAPAEQHSARLYTGNRPAKGNVDVGKDLERNMKPWT